MSNEKDTSKTVLIPLDVRKIEFYGDEITAVLIETEKNGPQVYVPLRPICEYLGLAWSSQLQRVKRDPVLSEALSSVFIMNTEAGQRYEVVCLHLDYISGWLFGIDANRVRPELRDKIILYRRECVQILARAFRDNALPLIETPSLPVSEAIAALQSIRQTALAVVELTEQQIALEERVANHDLRLDRAAEAFRGLRQRIEVVERRTAPPVLIRDDQAAQLKSLVKALAEHFTRLDNSKNHYGRIFETIYLQFGVTSYARIRQGQFEAVMRFLEDWRTAADAGHLEAPRQLTLFDQPSE